MTKSSQAAVDLIIAAEVTSQKVYEAKFQHPEWPGGQSGVTIGIGYDLGYSTADQVLVDWKDFLEPGIIRAMQSVAGIKGKAAHNAISSVRDSIVVPWNAAVSVFMRNSLPKWEATVVRAIPGCEKLPAGCFGVLTGLAYNRGASFSKDGDRYTEMRAIRTHVASGEWDKVPADLRSMKRLWAGTMQGLVQRREDEAVLWERSMAAYKPSPDEVAEDHARVDTGDDHGVTPEGNANEEAINVQPSRGRYDPSIEDIQTKLRSMHYYEVGTVDGISGGKLKGAIAAFMNDRRNLPVGEITEEFKSELNKAVAEGWSRPISPARANATAKDLPKIEALVHAWWQKLWAVALGAPAAAVTGFKGVFGDQPDALGYVNSVKNFFGAVPAEYYWLGIVGLAVAIFVQATRAQTAAVKAYQRGEIN